MNDLPDWYLLWVKKHARAFSFNAEAANTVLSWGPVFVKLFTANELNNATDELIGRTGIKYIADYRVALIECIMTERNRLREQKRQDNYSVCAFCHSTGWVSVPHPGMIPGTGRWYGYLRPPREDPTGITREVAVFCCCEIGQRALTAEQSRKRGGMTIDDYERKYPNYRLIMAEREAIQQAAITMPSATDFANLAQKMGDAAQIPRFQPSRN